MPGPDLVDRNFNTITRYEHHCGISENSQVKRELEAVNIIIDAVSQEDTPREELVKCIITLFHYRFQSEHEGAENSEYIYDSGLFHNDRPRDCSFANKFLHSQMSVPDSQ